ncbi:Dolichyl-phosphate-mannose-protein mannosyltransferase [Klenkia soli]|uniref:Dolichyl-phosphate-mannose-protein mannosyltransferase n=1 Tax=Klenkia soli TaxID=1052260 RepID=A0A1H0M297_9ACTN|nr:glycosyltransferase family 39 protein [Klenkia soli]SDO74525.1 Dolichyl-phosphate-mannose-protein mannosyltransferase [Klenkia soli]
MTATLDRPAVTVGRHARVEAARTRPRRGRGLVVAVHLVSAAVVVAWSQLAFLGRSLRLDEAQSLWQTNHTYGRLLELIAQDVHVPLYHVVLRTWRLVLGDDIGTARVLSLVFLLASLPLFYLVARSVLTQRWALFALVVFSTSPFVLWYGNEARMYTMLLLVTLASQVAFLAVVRRGRTAAWVGWAATAVVGAYVHYFFFFVLLAQGLFLLAVSRRLPGRTVLKLTGVVVLVVAAFLPWFLYFRANGSASGTRPQLPTPSSVDFSNVYSQFLFGFQSDPVNTTLVSAWPLLVLGALLSVRVGSRLDRNGAYLLVAAFVPVLTAFVVSHLVTPFFLSRYMVPAAPALLVLVVAFLAGLGPRVSKVLAGALLAVTVAGTTVQATSSDNPVEEDYRAAAELAEQAGPRDLVVVSSPFTIYPFEYYYDGAARVSTLPVWNRQQSAPTYDAPELPAEAQSLTDGHQYVYLVLSYDQGYQDDVYQYFASRYEQTAAYAPSDGLQVLVFRVGYAEVVPLGSPPA